MQARPVAQVDASCLALIVDRDNQRQSHNRGPGLNWPGRVLLAGLFERVETPHKVPVLPFSRIVVIIVIGT